MRYLIFWGTMGVLTLFLISLQSTLVNFIDIKSVRPDLIIIVVIIISLSYGSVAGTAFGLWAGMIQGAVMGWNLGALLISRVIIGYLPGLMRGRMFTRNLLVTIIFVFLGTLVGEFVFYLFSSSTTMIEWLRIVPGEALYNIPFSLFFYWLINYLYDHWIGAYDF